MENILISIDATVPEEGPPATHLFGALEVNIDNNSYLVGSIGTIEELALRTSDKAAAPEGVGSFLAYPVDSNDGESVGNSMTTHYGGPRLTLTLLFVGGVVRVEAYCRRIDKQLGTLKCHKTCCLGVPLVPAYKDAKTSYAGVNGLETEVARGEVELLVVGRIVGDMHLTILAGNATIALKDDSGIMVQSCSTTLEERGDEDYIMLTCQRAVELCGRSGNRLGKVKATYVLNIAEIQRVVKLLEHHKFRTLSCYLGNVLCKSMFVVIDAGGVVLLDNSYFHSSVSSTSFKPNFGSILMSEVTMKVTAQKATTMMKNAW